MTQRELAKPDLLLWTDVLERYARDWDATFDNKPHYFTQEFWYLFMGCLRNDWKGTPLTVSDACQVMKSGSNRTKEERIRKAVVDGYLCKQKHPEDGRETLLLPTEKLRGIVEDHLQRTLSDMTEALQKLIAPPAGK